MVLFFPLPFLATLHFAAPTWMWHLLGTWFVTLGIFRSWSRSLCTCIRQTSSIYSSESRLKFCLVANPRFLCFGSLAISSIRVACSITDSTSLSYSVSYADFSSESISSLDSGGEVWVNSFYQEWLKPTVLSFIPFIGRVYRMASSHALFLYI